jgi:YD repeat-containing protein
MNQWANKRSIGGFCRVLCLISAATTTIALGSPAMAQVCPAPTTGQWCPAQTTTYDALGRVVGVSDGLTTTSMTYDSLGRKIQMIDADLGTWTFQYDSNGNLTSQTDARNATINMTYDALNRITLKNLPYWNGTNWVSSVAAPLGDGEEDIVYEYDGLLLSGCPGNCDDHCATTQDICNAATGTCTHTGTPCTSSNGYSSDCTPNCSGTTCGSSDGCFGTCCAGSGCTLATCSSCQTLDICGGTCTAIPNGTSCTTSSNFPGSCQAGTCVCTPSCSGQACGSADGCGGTCCNGSGCAAPTCPTCQAPNSCGSACVAISDGTACTTSSGFAGSCLAGSCTCTPSCSGVACGSADGCGGTCCTGSACTAASCGTCQTLNSCGSACVAIPDGTMCTTSSGFAGSCQAGTCTCTPSCSGLACGSADGCGGTCCTGSGCTAQTCGSCQAASTTCSGACTNLPPTTQCAVASSCLQAAFCSGSSATCPSQTPVPDGTACSASSGSGTCFAGSCVANTALYQPLATGTLYTGVNWNYTMGYELTPNTPITVTDLGGLFSGTDTVYLFNRSTGAVLTSATVTAANTWAYASLGTRVSLAVNTPYTVAVQLPSSGGAYYTRVTLPVSNLAAAVNGSCYRYASSAEPCSASGVITSIMYGVADLKYALTPGCTQTCSGKACGSPDGCGGTCCLGSGCTAETCATGPCGGDSATCQGTCTIKPSTTLCSSATACAKASYCNGTSASCPVPQYRPPTAECAGAGICSKPSFCTGSSAVCPRPPYLPATTVCTPANGCASDSHCTGFSNACTRPLPLPATTLCAPATSCASAAYCNGTSTACPAQQNLPSTTVCAPASPCAAASVCTGTSPMCPAQTVSSDGSACTTSTGSASTCQSGFCGSTEPLYQPLAAGALYVDVESNSTMGYEFTPNKSIAVTHLGGLFNGTETVFLYNVATGAVLASATATSANNWAYAPLASPAVLSAGTAYSVGVHLVTGSTIPGAEFLSARLPASNADATVNGGCDRPGTSEEPCSYSGVRTSAVYGIADLRYQPALVAVASP